MAFRLNVVSDGVTDQYNIPFPYLRRAHVTVEDVGGNPIVFGWINDSRVLLQDPFPAGQEFTIVRRTPLEPLHTIFNNQPIPAAVYNDLIAQALYVSEEASLGGLAQEVRDELTASAGVVDAVWALLNGRSANLSALSTTAKDSLVAAINEINNELPSKSNVGHTHPWSQVTGKPTTYAPAAHTHGTSEVTGLASALGNRLRVDAAQTLTAAQILQAANNLDVGDTTTNFRAAYIAARDA